MLDKTRVPNSIRGSLDRADILRKEELRKENVSPCQTTKGEIENTLEVEIETLEVANRGYGKMMRRLASEVVVLNNSLVMSVIFLS